MSLNRMVVMHRSGEHRTAAGKVVSAGITWQIELHVRMSNRDR